MTCGRCCRKLFDTIPIPPIQRVTPIFNTLFPQGTPELKAEAVQFDLAERNIREFAVESNASLFGLKAAITASFLIAIIAYLGSKVWHNHSLKGGRHFFGKSYTVSECATKAQALYITYLVFANLFILGIQLHIYLKHRWKNEYSKLTNAHTRNVDYQLFIQTRAFYIFSKIL